MPSQVPVLYANRDTVVDRRDPRVKLLLLVLLFAYVFVAPTAQWMLIPVVAGLVTAVLARTPWRWVAVLWSIHIPTFIALILIGGWSSVTAGDWGGVVDAAEAEMRLVLAWTATILVSLSVFSAIDPDDTARGLRGIGLPAQAAFAVGLSYRLLYTTLTEAIQTSEHLKLRGVRLEIRHPVRFVRDALLVSLPVLFAVVRRGPTLMATMRMRGFATDPQLGRPGAADVVVLATALAVLVAAVLARWGPLPDTLLG
ncbi:energy-coupling factor transporter transmembrane protein EcfT [uncultured Modestobacter sp.]|uniref:energy-coupling factor transporter transmembrane component T family protein n=1 Tax=uncultured Modestobacter sp. TaxID=380048 RepID=UPI00263652CA|nr:energy-coupling factor transporter transmembrane component T [uncultured Modestobacter sp.]